MTDPAFPATARQRAREEITGEILAVARRHLVEHGGAGLSLRAVTRDVGMVSSAVYRYFPSRDDLLTRLIVDGYDALADVAEAADAAVAPDAVEARCVAVALAVRQWALDHRHEYELLYGTPVPGYAAPADTVDPAIRVSLVMVRILADGVAAGLVRVDEPMTTTRAVRANLATMRAALGVAVPDSVLARGLLAWTQMFGHISFEMFGHLKGGIEDYDGFFELQTRRMAAYVVNGA